MFRRYYAEAGPGNSPGKSAQGEDCRIVAGGRTYHRLGLQRGAAADDVRQAYRDLVKVWHPDRFGSEARLRAKAESQLKEINSAYRTLAAAGFRTDFVRTDCGVPAAAGPERAWRPRATTCRPQMPPVSSERKLRFGLYAFATALLAGMAIFVAHQVRLVPRSEAQPMAVAAPTKAADPAKTPPTKHEGWRSMGTHSGSPEFRVWSLSQRDSDRVQTACSAHPPGTEGYRSCVATQVRAMDGSSADAEMPGMSKAERQAAEAACSRAEASGSRAVYNRCLNRQLAELAAEPVRPDLSGFSETDRRSMERACAQSHEGGAAEYDRCVTRFARMLGSALR